MTADIGVSGGGNTPALAFIIRAIAWHVSRTALQDEPTIAIAAIDIALFVDLHVDTGMAERRMAGAGAVAGDPGYRHIADFGHERIERRHGNSFGVKASAT